LGGWGVVLDIKKPWWENKENLDPSQDGNDKSIKRIWKNHELWEDAKGGMYKTVTGQTRAFMLENAIDFTGDHTLYGNYMSMVIDLWPESCEHNLSAMCMNRRAWIGHAACCLGIGCPEDITREAWGHLSGRQRKLANNEADMAIKKWENKHRGEGAKDISGAKRTRCSSGANFGNVRPVQQNIFEFLRRQGQHSDAAPCR